MASESRFSILLGLNLFLKSLKFGESYLTQFLSESFDLSESDVNNRIYPVFTYSYMIFLLPATFVSWKTTPYFQMILESVPEAITYAMLVLPVLFTKLPFSTLLWMQIMQVIYGFSCAFSKGVFDVFRYRKDPQAPIRTGRITPMVLFGHTFGSLTGVLSLLYLQGGKKGLFVLMAATLASLVLAAILTLWIYIRETFTPLVTKDTVEDPLNMDEFSHGKNSNLTLIKEPALIFTWPVFILLSLAHIMAGSSLALGESYQSSLIYEALQITGRINGESAGNFYSGVMYAAGKILAVFGSYFVTVVLKRNPDFRMSILRNIHVPAILLLAMSLLFGLVSFWVPFSSVSLFLWMSAWSLAICFGHSFNTILIVPMVELTGDESFSAVLALLSFLGMVVQSLFHALVAGFAPSMSATRRYSFYAVMGLIPLVFLGIIAIISRQKTRIAPPLSE